ncbi:MAG: hypothetical protein ACD_7C00280G0002 [uncultured bacterium]|nr:MAG: hypothetical protein ACD_7C00280G0002 [uncultured bacterium]
MLPNRITEILLRPLTRWAVLPAISDLLGSQDRPFSM